ncbi:hypothetical protein CTAYLR_003841 [Chrysophaeum taylorii]|uniref:Large ribosomal subunit protein uL4m n=1 Tax=Chrysophaeum taylorii TaxID=2483200 RepID=A0AAD7UFW8_9STRA|nr:hypothetical protein CTAYLR_003841 [Chrysophaeum taylorii]
MMLRRLASTLPSNLKGVSMQTIEKFRASEAKKAVVVVPPSELFADPVLRVEPFIEGTSESSELRVPWRVFKEPERPDVLHQYVTWQRANWRQVHRAAKTRGEVRGSGRKLRPQKGSGMARVGSARVPIRRGGSKAHGPKRRDFAQALTKQTRKLAMRCVLSQKFREGNLVVVSDLGGTGGKTKTVAAEVDRRWSPGALFVYDTPDDLFLRASRNLPKVDVSNQKSLGVHAVLKRKHLVLTKQACLLLINRLNPAAAAD